MRYRKFLLAGGALAVGLGLATGCQVTRAGYASAPYKVLHAEGRVEIRSYPAMQLAETPTGGDDFMRLFRYISKGNAAEEAIPMTTPVFMSGLGTTNGRMAFVMPAGLSNPPAPANSEVWIRETQPTTVAVLRFRGGQQGPDGEAARTLTTWLSTHGVPADSPPTFAYFDPPWIPGFLCRNEVMIQTSWPGSPPPTSGTPSP